jgi:D-alanyl-D-alanine carboxypeptidase
MMKIGDKMKKRKIKKGPKIVLILLIVFLAIGGLIINQKNQETEEKPKKQTKEEQKIEKLKSIPYYKKEYQKRYLEYQKENPNLSVENIVTYVNIGIDKPYYTNTKKAENLNTNLILVNKYNYLTEDYIPENLEPIDIAYARSGMQLVREAKEAFETLSEDAKKEGMNIIAMSSYRSYDYQVNLYDNYVATDGKEAADTYSARAGYSEHQTGLAVDVYNKVLPYTSFEETEEFNWMQENAYKYGFILRFPKDKVNITGYQYESWHYRYVGKEAAKYIHDHDLTLEEYYVKKVEKN